MNIKNVLVTGANGLLGHHTCKALTEHGIEVAALTHNTSLSPLPGVRYYSIDFGTFWEEAELPNQCDAVIHLAQSGKFRNFPKDALDVFKVNIESTARLLDYARRRSSVKFIFASSGGVYGNGMSAFHENSPIVPPDELGYYLGSKMSGEILAQSYADIFQVITMRFFFMYGSGQHRNMLIPRLMEHVLTGKPITLQGRNGIRINPVHVKDATDAVIAALFTEHSATYNISGPEVLSIREICDSIGYYLRQSPNYRIFEGEPKDLLGDNSAMCSLLIKPSRRLFEHLDDVRKCLG